MPVPVSRPTCLRCRRPISACWCGGLTPVSTRTRVVFLQHPRESRVAIGTARMAHLGLMASELHEGVEFAGHPRVEELLLRPGTALLFPGEGAVSPESLAQPPETLLVIDGTWPQARKMLSLNPALRALPRIGFRPRRPGNYRIRREPAEHCVATIEAVVEVLAALERDEERFAPLLKAFESMVDHQIAAAAARTGPPRRRLKPADPWWESPSAPDLEALWPNLVAVAAEANAHRRDSGVPGRPELVHLAAVRLASGDLFNAFLAPRRPLAPGAPHHLEVTREDLLGGGTVDGELARWTDFVGSSGILAGWGNFAVEQLSQEAWRPASPPMDLRLLAAHRLKRRPGSAEAALAALGGVPERGARLPGRAGRTAFAVAGFLERMREEQRLGPSGRSTGRASEAEEVVVRGCGASLKGGSGACRDGGG